MGRPWNTGPAGGAAILSQLFHTLTGNGLFSGDLWLDPFTKSRSIEV